MPSYSSDNYDISLNEAALAGTRMGGYKSIDYDLSRYVLVDDFDSNFTQYGYDKKDQFAKLISKATATKPQFQNIRDDQFIISAAFAYLLDKGWTEEEFYNFTKNENGDGIVGGLDIAIRRQHHAATHGSKSNIMTVCEKYVWQFRNHMYGF